MSLNPTIEKDCAPLMLERSLVSLNPTIEKDCAPLMPERSLVWQRMIWDAVLAVLE